MKKWLKLFPVLLVIFALLVAGVACGGGNSGDDGGDDNGRSTETVDGGDGDGDDDGGDDNGDDDGGDDNGGDDDGGQTAGEYPVMDDATDVISAPNALTYQTKHSVDEVMEFYKSEMKDAGWELTSETTMAGTGALTFSKDGANLSIGIVEMAGMVSVTIGEAP